jgi:hypothetical protein
VAGNLSKGLCAAAVLSITVVALAGGCNHSRSTLEGATAVSDEVSQVSQALVGKQISIRGKFSLRGKVGPYIVLDNQQEVYLEATRGRLRGGNPTLKWRANSSPRLAPSGFITSLPPANQQTDP